MDNPRIIHAPMNGRRYTVTAPITQYDYGYLLLPEGEELPTTYEIDFSNDEHKGTSLTVYGDSNGAEVPEELIRTGKDVFAFYYKVGEDYGKTDHTWRIPNHCRPSRDGETPTPSQQSSIDQLIVRSNEAVTSAEQSASEASASAQNASADAERAEEARTGAQNYADMAEQARDNAQTYANNASASATASAQSASDAETARQATTSLVAEAQGYANASAQSAQASAQSASQAQQFAQTASLEAESAQDYATQADISANTASNKASEASGYASTASQKATEASQSASQALTYKTDAESAKTAAQTAQGKAEDAQTAAETAQGLAEDAQAAAESVAESIPSDYSQLSEDVSDLKEGLSAVEEVVFTETAVIDATDSLVIESTSEDRIAHLYNFIAGKKYRLEVTVNNAFFTNANNALRADTSKAVTNSTAYLNTGLLRINNTTANPITAGSKYSVDFIALDTDVNILMRYKFDVGSQDISVKCYEISDIGEKVSEVSNNLETLERTVHQRSRMLMGAHRGAEYFAPPNSVAAYEIAGKMGFPWAWLAQIRWSSSGTLYVIHDADVSVTTNGIGNIQDLTDEYISGLLCNKITSYDYSKFTDDDLRVPTLEKAIQICLKYGMKMCFRIEPFPNQIETELGQTIWDNFEKLVKEYDISADWCCYSGYNAAEMVRCITLFGEDAELCPYLGPVSAQDVVDWFNAITSVTVKNKSILLYAGNLTLADVKLLHTNGIKVYAFTGSSTPTQEMMEQLAYWGVDILQNPRYARIPVV